MKKISNHRRKRKTISKINHIYEGHFQIKLPHTSDFTRDPVVQFACDAPVAKDNFVDDGDMQMIANKF